MSQARSLIITGTVFVFVLGLSGPSASGSTPGPDVRLTNDDPASTGYVSNYNVNHPGNGVAKDETLAECSRARGRQNEPSVAVDPRDKDVIVGSSNDYCGVYNDGEDDDGAPIPSGPIWIGYYRSQNGGSSFRSSLVPGYPGDNTPYAARSGLRTASAGDAVLAWDKQGRLFAGTETSGDPAGTKKGFGDVGVATYVNPDGTNGATKKDGKEFQRSVIVDRGVSAPVSGQFNDKTAIEVDRTQGACSGNVYFTYSRFDGNGGNSIQFSRSTDHGANFSQPGKVSASVHGVQFADISVTANGHVYVTYRQFADKGQSDAVIVVKSTDCGQSFSKPKVVQTFTPYDAQDVLVTGGGARDCGDFGAACKSGYTFFRQDSQIRSTADQRADTNDEKIYIVYNATIDGTETDTGTTYGSVSPGVASREGIYFVRYNGATGAKTKPKLVDPQAGAQQLFPDLSIEGGPLHVLWWDSRKDDCFSVDRPIGNCADRSLKPALDVFATTSSNGGNSFATSKRVSDVTTNPNFEQFAGRTVPFAGDYLWISAIGKFAYGTWTDWRDTVGGVDQREADEPDNDTNTGDINQCRTKNDDGTYTGDTCPRKGGLDQNIYGDLVP
ncbi:MAG: sialidase family protein [Geodermatophilaceae bacterium]